MITSTDIIRARENNISEGALRERIKRGWSKEAATTVPTSGDYSKYWKIAQENNVSRRTYEGRIYNLGWTYEQAANVPVRKYKKTGKYVGQSKQ